MKAINGIMLISALLVTSITQANVKPKGTPVPYLCSTPEDGISTSVVAVQSVCFAHIQGSDDNAITINLNDGTTQVWKVEDRSTLTGNYEFTREKLDISYLGEIRAGGFTSSRGDARNAFLIVTNSRRTSIAISAKGTLPGNLKIDVRGFEFVAVTL